MPRCPPDAVGQILTRAMVAVAAAGGAADFALVEIADRQKHPRAFGAAQTATLSAITGRMSALPGADVRRVTSMCRR